MGWIRVQSVPFQHSADLMPSAALPTAPPATHSCGRPVALLASAIGSSSSSARRAGRQAVVAFATRHGKHDVFINIIPSESIPLAGKLLGGGAAMGLCACVYVCVCARALPQTVGKKFLPRSRRNVYLLLLVALCRKTTIQRDSNTHVLKSQILD